MAPEQVQKKRKVALLKAMLWSGATFPLVVVALFFIIHDTVTSIYQVYLNLALVALSATMLLNFKKVHHHYNVMFYTLLIVSFIVFGAAVILAPADPNRLMWLIILMLSSYYLGGKRVGVISSVLVFVFVVFVDVVGYFDANPTTYISGFIFVLFAYYFTHTLEKSEEIIIKQSHEKDLAKQKLLLEKEAKERFLANMSHEIRTPLNAIIGFLELLTSTRLTKEQTEHLKVISNSSNDLIRIINDILDLSKIDAKKLELEIIPTDLHDLELLIQLNRVNATNKSLQLDFWYDDRIQENLLTDPTRLKQVLQNLLSNAIKFTNQGSVALSISMQGEDEDFYHVTYEVRDTGLGISEDKINSLFQAYVQTDASVNRVFGGTGLGLNISKNLVELLGGHLEVKSKLGFGTRFFFTLKHAKTNQQALHIEQGKPVKIAVQNLTILVADDVASNRLLIRKMLEKEGINCVDAADGIEAFERFKEEKFDLILMDGNMPVCNGIESAKMIKEYEQTNQLPHTPIIALSANVLKQEIDEMLSVMDDYLSKPISLGKLTEMINKYLAESPHSATQKSD